MLEHEKDRQLNTLLDSLLSGYSAVEPRPGLDTRIRADLRARVAQRRRGWMLIFAAAAAVVVLAAWMTKARTLQPGGPGHVVVEKQSPELVRAGTVSSAPQKTTRAVANHRHSGEPGRGNSRSLLQVANAMHGADSLIFEQEKLYLSPAPQGEPEPVVEPQTPAPSISIQNLGVQPVEIKELPSAKGMDSKGNL